MTNWHKIIFLLILQKAAYRQKQTKTSRIDTKLVFLTKISCIVSRFGKKLAKIWNISKMIYIYSIFRKFNQISMLSLFVQFSLWHFYKLIFFVEHIQLKTSVIGDWDYCSFYKECFCQVLAHSTMSFETFFGENHCCYCFITFYCCTYFFMWVIK